MRGECFSMPVSGRGQGHPRSFLHTFHTRILMNKLGKDKHSSLVRTLVNYDHKIFEKLVLDLNSGGR